MRERQSRADWKGGRRVCEEGGRRADEMEKTVETGRQRKQNNLGWFDVGSAQCPLLVLTDTTYSILLGARRTPAAGCSATHRLVEKGGGYIEEPCILRFCRLIILYVMERLADRLLCTYHVHSTIYVSTTYPTLPYQPTHDARSSFFVKGDMVHTVFYLPIYVH